MTDDAFVHGEVSAGDEMHIDYEFLDDIEAEIDELKFSIGISTNFNFGRTGGAGIDESTYFKIELISGKLQMEIALTTRRNYRIFSRLPQESN